MYTHVNTQMPSGVPTPRFHSESMLIKSARTCALFTCTHTYKHIHIYICLQTCAHRFPAGYTLLDDNPNPWLSKTRACVTYSLIHIRTYIQTYTHIYIVTHTQTQRCPAGYTLLDYDLNPGLSKTRACVLYSLIHIHTHIQTYTHLYMYAYTHTDAHRGTPS